MPRFRHTGAEQFFDLAADPGQCHDLAGAASAQARIDVRRRRLTQVDEDRGDPRGQGGRLGPQPGGALRLSPNYERWKARAAETNRAWQGPA